MKLLSLASKFLLILIITSVLLTGSVWHTARALDQVRMVTRTKDFDFIGWTAGALLHKLHAYSLGTAHYYSEYQRRMILRDFFQLHNEINQLSDQLETLLSDPAQSTPDQDVELYRQSLVVKHRLLHEQSLLAESVVQDYVSQALKELGLTAIRLPFPPVLIRSSDLPKNLIISPREIIRQEKSMSLQTDLTLFEIVQLETFVEDVSDYSALVVPVGGISTFPAMVMRTTNLPFLLEATAHEWAHHFLIFRPLGLLYHSSPDLRTMNETAATIVGQEISDYIIHTYFSDLIVTPQPYSTWEVAHSYSGSHEIEKFNFRREMYQTRLRVDDLLGEGKIKEAEAYMEERRLFFWENGFQIRKLNQAYFAFHGAYADQPFSAAGADPVGEDVRALRARSQNLADFIHTISWMSSYKTLHDLIRSF